MRIRYEDFCTNTEKEAGKLLSFLGLSFHPRVREFIKSHSHSQSDTGDWLEDQVHRETKDKAYSWTADWTFNTMVKIQTECKPLLHKLSYQVFETESQYEEYRKDVFAERGSS